MSAVQKQRKQRPWPLAIIPTICLLIATAGGLWHPASLLADLSQLVDLHIGQSASNFIQPADPALRVPEAYRQATETTGRQYMTALFDHRYASMWGLLQPQVRSVWPNETAFARYWQRRFQHYSLERFVFGVVRWLPRWVDPETMTTYKQVLELPISLALKPDQSMQQELHVPPEDLHPSQVFQSLPFIVQRIAKHDNMQERWLVLDGGPADLEAPILPPLQPTITTVQVPILMYHHISDSVPHTALGMSLTVTPAMFREQLDYLKRQGYTTITFNQLFDALYYGGPLPRHPIILTFDDGYDDAYRFAFPILKAYGFSGTFYIITGKVGWAAYLSWQQMRTMLAEGMRFGSHTVHHVDLGNLLLYSQSMVQQELQQSQEALQQHLGVVVQQFCYPSGEPFRDGTAAARQQIVAMLAADDYVGAATDPGVTGTYQSSGAPFVLLRIRVDGRASFQDFTYSLP